MRFNYLILLCPVVCAIPMQAEAQDRITEADMPQSWLYSEAATQTLPTEDAWWSQFGDSTLDSLISIGVRNNYDVLAAQRRIAMAQTGITQAQAQYYPVLTANAGYVASRTAGTTTSRSVPATNISYFDLGVNMNWQIDIFGKVRAQADQSRAAYRATRVQYDATMVTVSAKIATVYMQLRTLQAQREVLTQHIERQKKVTDITNARHEAGLASMLDVTQSQTTYYSTLASLTSVNTSIATTINAIAVLTGTYPSEIAPLLEASAPLPEYHQLVAAGVPMELLRRRPDIVAAEYQLAQYAAALGVAKKDFLPTLSLSGSIGTQAHDMGDMFTSRSFTYSVAPTLSWTIFDGMSRRASVESAREQMQIGIDNYNSTVLTAVQEVESAMATYYNSLQYIETIERVTDEAGKAYTLSIDLYKQGLTAFINVTSAQITFLQYANELVAAKGQALNALVTLYEALGGGWSM